MDHEDKETGRRKEENLTQRKGEAKFLEGMIQFV